MIVHHLFPSISVLNEVSSKSSFHEKWLVHQVIYQYLVLEVNMLILLFHVCLALQSAYFLVSTISVIYEADQNCVVTVIRVLGE